MTILLAIFVGLLLLLGLIWPLIAIGVAWLLYRAVRRLDKHWLEGERITPAWVLALTGWSLTAAAGWTVLAAYGFGLSRTTFGLLGQTDSWCSRHGIGPEEMPPVWSPDYTQPPTGGLSMWPIEDTSCGADNPVPVFVNPLVVVAAVLFVVLLVATITVSRQSPAETAGLDSGTSPTD